MTKSKTSTPTLNKVLAIDPGFDRVGVAVMEKVGNKEGILFSTCIETDRKAEQAERLRHIGERLREIILTFSPTELAIEKLFFNQNITTGIKVAEARGVILYEGARAGLRAYEYTPQSIKAAVTGYGKASKPDMLRLVTRLVQLTHKPKHDDELDAIAVGITHLASVRRV